MTHRKCSLPDCDNPYRSKGYCQAHYSRLRLHGSPSGGAPMRARAAGLTCSVPDCARKVRCNGICRVHYDRLRANGRFDLTVRPTPDERFWSRVVVSQAPPFPFRPVPGPCWEWAGALTGQGYGNVWHDERYRAAHRVSYEWWHGDIDPDLTLDHLCRVRSCVNPDHLEQVTLAENNRRAMKFKMRQKATR